MIDFHVVGLNHKTSSLPLRERLAIAPEQQLTFIAEFKARTGVKEVGILITCNRCEWFWSGGQAAVVQNFLMQYFSITAIEWQSAFYLYHHNFAVKHFIEVAVGLDSMMLGETQIFGQLKMAFQQMQQAQTLGEVMQQIFPAIFAAAKKVRSQTQLVNRTTSIAQAAVDLICSIFNEITKIKVLFIGAGATIQLAVQHLAGLGVQTIWVANRTVARAEQLTAQYGGSAIALSDIPQYLPEVDVVISATASSHCLITHTMLQNRLQNPSLPLYMIDLAMPRDIEEAVRALPQVFLYNVDDLQAVIQEAKIDQNVAIQQAQNLIEQELVLFSAKQRSRVAVPDICNYRSRMEQLRDDEINKSLQLLKSNIPAEEVLQRLAYGLTNKFMHEPTVFLRALSTVTPLVELEKELELETELL